MWATGTAVVAAVAAVGLFLTGNGATAQDTVLALRGGAIALTLVAVLSYFVRRGSTTQALDIGNLGLANAALASPGVEIALVSSGSRLEAYVRADAERLTLIERRSLADHVKDELDVDEVYVYTASGH